MWQGRVWRWSSGVLCAVAVLAGAARARGADIPPGQVWAEVPVQPWDAREVAGGGPASEANRSFSRATLTASLIDGRVVAAELLGPPAGDAGHGIRRTAGERAADLRNPAAGKPVGDSAISGQRSAYGPDNR